MKEAVLAIVFLGLLIALVWMLQRCDREVLGVVGLALSVLLALFSRR